ncbi:vesicle-associated membrane protein 3 [Nephila pilipes]|uniref:Vesicle-associated membrane protein 3 n=1 Tax=Nephila pilipes TaxID=299642 RepID=A0A8X6QWH6_NEPPI|nr:vesicle-associated membrane protein 3 [Nephila pilipes]
MIFLIIIRNLLHTNIYSTKKHRKIEKERKHQMGDVYRHSCIMSTEKPEALSPPTRQPNPQQSAASKRLQQTQAQVDEVVDIMRTNVEKVLERDQKLSELDDRADALQQGASQFEQQAGKLKRKFWWKNCKMWAILIGVILIIIIVIVVANYA